MGNGWLDSSNARMVCAMSSHERSGVKGVRAGGGGRSLVMMGTGGDVRAPAALMTLMSTNVPGLAHVSCPDGVDPEGCWIGCVAGHVLEEADRWWWWFWWWLRMCVYVDVRDVNVWGADGRRGGECRTKHGTWWFFSVAAGWQVVWWDACGGEGIPWCLPATMVVGW